MDKGQLLKIAQEYGSPVYVYDAGKIQSQYLRLTSAFKSVKNLKINYAEFGGTSLLLKKT